MMREFGAAGAFLLAWFLTMAFLTVVSVFAPVLASARATASPPIVAIICAVAFFAVYQSFGRPMFVFLLLVMILLATTELGTDGWITDLLTPDLRQQRRVDPHLHVSHHVRDAVLRRADCPPH
jgi:hypothetical protein